MQSRILAQEFVARAAALRQTALGLRSVEARNELMRLAADYEKRAAAIIGGAVLKRS
jgi:hypothetical protein